MDLINEGNNLRAVQGVYKTLNDHTQTLNQDRKYSIFFAVVRFLCYQYLLLSICKIFDQSKYTETSSLKYLKKALNEGVENENDRDKLVNAIDDLLCDHCIAATLSRVEEIRNQLIAHKQTDAEQKAMDITLNEVFRLIEKSRRVINKVACGINYSETIPSSNEKFIQAVMQVLAALFKIKKIHKWPS